MRGSLAMVRHVLALGCLAALPAIPQSAGGVFRGEVRDPSDAVVSQAQIVIWSQDTGAEVSAASNSDGLYLSPSLIPGSYILSVSRPGFKSEDFGPVLLQVNQTVRVDFALKVGQLTESIVVEAGGEQLLSTEGAEIGQVIARQTVARDSPERTSVAAAYRPERGRQSGRAGRNGFTKSGQRQWPTHQGESVPGGRRLRDLFFGGPR